MTFNAEEFRRTMQAAIAAGHIVPPPPPKSKVKKTLAEKIAYARQRRAARNAAMQRLRERRRQPWPANCVPIPAEIVEHFEMLLPYERKIMTALCKATWGPYATRHPMTVVRLALATRLPEAALRLALERLLSGGWVDALPGGSYVLGTKRISRG